MRRSNDLRPFFGADDTKGCRRRSNTPPTALLILVPGALGGLQAFVRRASGVPTAGPAIARHDDLRAYLRQLPQPRAVVLCGSRNAIEVANTVLDIADLFVVPHPWLRAVHPTDTAARAALAARLVTAHRNRPIEHFCALDKYDIFF